MEGQSLFSVRRGKRYKHYSLSIIEKQNKTTTSCFPAVIEKKDRRSGLTREFHNCRALSCPI